MFIDAAEALRPTIRACQTEIERGRRIPPALSEQLREAGFYRMLVPQALGGAQVDLNTFYRVLELVAEGDGATGWNLATSSAICWSALSLPDEGLAEIFGDGPDVRFAGTTRARGGTAQPVEGGYLVSGRWRFGSGCQEAQWLGGACQITDEGAPRTHADGSPSILRVFLPAAAGTIIDTWNVTGLCGTGSHDWTVSDVFVPARRTQDFDAKWHQWPGTLYALSVPPTGGMHFSAVATGIAQTAIAALLELAGAKTPTAATGLLRDKPQTQDWVGRAIAMLDAAQTYRAAVAADMWDTAAAGRRMSQTQLARRRLAASYSVDNALQAVELVCRAAGTTAIDRADLIGRCWRDLHVIGQNYNVDQEFYPLAGRVYLGLEPGPRLE